MAHVWAECLPCSHQSDWSQAKQSPRTVRQRWAWTGTGPDGILTTSKSPTRLTAESRNGLNGASSTQRYLKSHFVFSVHTWALLWLLRGDDNHKLLSNPFNLTESGSAVHWVHTVSNTTHESAEVHLFPSELSKMCQNADDEKCFHWFPSMFIWIYKHTGLTRAKSKWNWSQPFKASQFSTLSLFDLIDNKRKVFKIQWGQLCCETMNF